MQRFLISIFLVLFLHVSLKSQTLLWGTTHEGGPNGLGTIFVSDSTGTNFHTVFGFQAGIAKAPIGGLCLANNGSFYGVTGLNGFHHDSYCYTYNSATANYSNLHDFFATAGLGWCAKSRLIQSTNGTLYGLCAMGGNGNANTFGIIYSVEPTTETYNPIYLFDSINGAHPYGSLMEATNGKLYGITANGGAHNSGVLFSFDPTTLIYSNRYDFTSPIGGVNYYASLQQATNGKFYGTTQYGGANNNGEIFSFDESTSTFIDLFDFDFQNGANPQSNLIEAADGNFYGLTYSGGVDSLGVLYRVDTNGNYTKLFDFTGINGAHPSRRLLQTRNGKLFGTTLFGGINNVGVVFSYDISSNTYTKLLDFNTNSNGAYPECELIETPLIGIQGIINLIDEKEFSVSPNPFIIKATIAFSDVQHNTTIKIIDVIGKEIKSINFSGKECVIEKGELKSGIYFLQTSDENKKVINRKLVVQ